MGMEEEETVLRQARGKKNGGYSLPAAQAGVAWKWKKGRKGEWGLKHSKCLRPRKTPAATNATRGSPQVSKFQLIWTPEIQSKRPTPRVKGPGEAKAKRGYLRLPEESSGPVSPDNAKISSGRNCNLESWMSVTAGPRRSCLKTRSKPH